jgi:hypothetical protein
MNAPLTKAQSAAGNIARMSASTETSAAAAHGILNAGIVLTLAWPAMMLGIASALLAPLGPPPPR